MHVDWHGFSPVVAKMTMNMLVVLPHEEGKGHCMYPQAQMLKRWLDPLNCYQKGEGVTIACCNEPSAMSR